MKPYALLLAGGAGTRFWPASRAQMPKQLLPLVSAAPLLREAAERVLPITGGWERVLVAGGKHLEDATRRAVPDLPRDNLLLEPVPRNTAPCIAWAVARIARIDPSALVMVLPSDPHIGDVEAFRRTIRIALASAESGVITTIGIKPTRPETGYGYIELEAPPSATSEAAAIPAVRFVEKPNLARAEAFVASRRFLWNAGMFFFKASDLLDAVRKHMPALATALDRIAVAEANNDPVAFAKAFGAAPSVSLDVGVMEKLERIAVVPGDFEWSDVGSWQSAWELAKKDGEGNAAPESAVLVDAKQNLVVDLRTNPAARTIALVGVEGLAVVATDDAILVLPRERAQDVRNAVEALRARGATKLL